VKLAESSECPTIVVPRSWTSGHGAVVVGVDADLEDQPALRFAVHEARVLHRRLRVVHCWQVPFVRTLAGVSPSSLAEAAARQTRALAGILERLRAEHTDLDIRGEAAGQEILVVGAHRRTAEERLFLGSTSREILARPPCPVAVVRARAI
jgi:nucleotide-binding universal stress UspA family protein